MNLDLKDRNFLILGASSGFGHHIATRIAEEGGAPILVARSKEKLEAFVQEHPGARYIVADLFSDKGLQQLWSSLGEEEIDGVLINSGGPKAGSFPMTLSDWDEGYQVVLRWKVQLMQWLMPRLEKRGYGRLVFIESVSVREPIQGLVLSNVYRMAVVGLMKSIVNELQGKDILINMLAPGYHLTDRLESLIHRKSEELGVEESEVARSFAENTTLKSLGDPDSLAGLAVWLLSPQNSYVTGQIIPVEGGLTKGI